MERGPSPRLMRRMVAVARLWPCLVLTALAAPALAGAVAAGEPQAAAEERGTLTVTWENDRWAATDRHYTNGIEFAYLTPPLPVDHWVDDIADATPGLELSSETRLGFSLGQSMFTPGDTSAVSLVEDDRPYAGWLYGGLAILTADEDSLQTYALNLGIVGPYAAGEPVQNSIHRLIDVDTADGWSNQLENEPGAVLTYEYKWRQFLPVEPGLLEFDVMPHAGVALGNVFTYGAMGATLRIGADLPNDFGAPRLRPSLPGSNFFKPDDAFGWYLFAGAEGRYVLRNIFLDGNSFADSHSVDKEPLVGDLQVGAVLTIFDARLAATYVFRTKEFQGQDRADEFAALSLSLKY